MRASLENMVFCSRLRVRKPKNTENDPDSIVKLNNLEPVILCSQESSKEEVQSLEIEETKQPSVIPSTKTMDSLDINSNHAVQSFNFHKMFSLTKIHGNNYFKTEQFLTNLNPSLRLHWTQYDARFFFLKDANESLVAGIFSTYVEFVISFLRTHYSEIELSNNPKLIDAYNKRLYSILRLLLSIDEGFSYNISEIENYLESLQDSISKVKYSTGEVEKLFIDKLKSRFLKIESELVKIKQLGEDLNSTVNTPPSDVFQNVLADKVKPLVQKINEMPSKKDLKSKLNVIKSVADEMAGVKSSIPS